MVPAFAQDSAANPIVARVNNVDIRESDVTLADQDIGKTLPDNNPQKKREFLIGYLIDLNLLADAAKKLGLVDDAEEQRIVNFERNRLLMEKFLVRIGKASVTDATLQNAYNDAVRRLGDETEFHIREILFRVTNSQDEGENKIARDKAIAAVQRIKKGEDFAAVATQLTESPTGKQNGGDLGYLSKRQMSEQINAVVATLTQGQVSDPVGNESGWHVIKLEDKRTRQPPAFDSVRGELEAAAYRKGQFEFVARLHSEAKIERFDDQRGAKPVN
jgi:parvulin-like peptidyl-prolyl isomerase